MRLFVISTLIILSWSFVPPTIVSPLSDISQRLYSVASPENKKVKEATNKKKERVEEKKKKRHCCFI